MKKILLSLTIVLNFLHANSQEIDPNFTTKKSKELKQFDKAVHGFNFKIGVNTFLTQSLPNEIENTKYDLNDQLLVPSSNQAIVGICNPSGISGDNDTVSIAYVNYNKPIGLNAAIGYKFKLNSRFFLSTDFFYNMNFISRSVESTLNNYSNYNNSRRSMSIAIPISILYHFNKKINLELGFNYRYNFVIRSYSRNFYLDQWIWDSKLSFKQKNSLSLFVGTTYQFNRQLFLNFRFYLIDQIVVKPLASRESYNIDSEFIRFIPYHVLKNQVQLNIGYILPNKD
jgi:hypothetical protein